MAEKQICKGNEFFLIFSCIVLTSILIGGCSHVHRSFPAKAAFEEANALFSRGSYQAALDRYERLGQEHPSSRERALFEMGIIHAYPQNDQRDDRKALQCFEMIMRDYPNGSYRQDSETMIININNVALKDRAIASQQQKIELLQQQIEAYENEIRGLKKKMEALERKYFSFVLERGTADRIRIEKEERRLTLFLGGEVLKTYSIALGGNPIGPKERQGDRKTPEGTYTIESRNRDSRYHLALRLSYPNERDRERAKALGVSPGGDIMIHGLKKGFSEVGQAHTGVDWTEGCIAVTDKEIEEIERLAPNGTLVEIMP